MSEQVTIDEIIAEMHDLIGEGTSSYSMAYNSAVRECVRIAERIKAPPSGYVLVNIGTLTTWYILASQGNAIPTYEIKALMESKETK